MRCGRAGEFSSACLRAECVSVQCTPSSKPAQARTLPAGHLKSRLPALGLTCTRQSGTFATSCANPFHATCRPVLKCRGFRLMSSVRRTSPPDAQHTRARMQALDGAGTAGSHPARRLRGQCSWQWRRGGRRGGTPARPAAPPAWAGAACSRTGSPLRSIRSHAAQR